MEKSTVRKFKIAVILAAFLLVVPPLAGLMFAVVGAIPYLLAGAAPVVLELGSWAVTGVAFGAILWGMTGIAVCTNPRSDPNYED